MTAAFTGRAARLAAAALAIAALGSTAACKPSLDETVSIINGPTVLAVRTVPPEVVPNAMNPMTPVTYTALYVNEKGLIMTAGIEWDFCTAREPLAELGPVNNECLAASGPQFTSIGTGISATGLVPVDGCNEFGPDVPMSVAGQTAGRPVDPDSTGGFYQPARFLAQGASGVIPGIAEERIACGLALGTPNQIGEFNQQYHMNENPTVKSLSLVSGNTTTPLMTDADGQTNTVTAGAHLTLEVSWPTCPLTDVCGDGVCGPDETPSMNQTTTAMMGNMNTNCPAPTVSTCTQDCSPAPLGCSGAERYFVFDLTSQCLEDTRESIDVAWFATGGTFDNDRTGVDGSDTTTTSDNGWTAPASGTVTLWVVLRDARGGAGWAEYKLAVQ